VAGVAAIDLMTSTGEAVAPRHAPSRGTLGRRSSLFRCSSAPLGDWNRITY